MTSWAGTRLIKSTSKEYKNIYTNIWLQLGIISYCKMDISGACGVTLGCRGFVCRNNTWLWAGLRRVTFINILKYYMVWDRIVFL